MDDQKSYQKDMSAKRAILKFATRTLRQKGKSLKMPEAHIGQTGAQTNLQSRHVRQMGDLKEFAKMACRPNMKSKNLPIGSC